MTDRKILTDKQKLGGEAFLENTRVRVSDIALKYEQLGYSKKEILDAYPRLDQEDVEKALNFYYRNKERFKGSGVEAA
jgi:uncharacterized protein (DUF433 family)